VTSDENQIKKTILHSVAECSSCGKNYGPDNLEILGHRGELWFLSVSCERCRNRGLIAAFITDDGEEPDIVTDVSEEEFRRFNASSLVTSDDLLDVHEFLKDFDGDFTRLFTGR
jgi:hypothetical protein